ncbi:MAG: hypothetical protein WC238_02920 [Parcubacteria group bacterium]|jgi:hypothetical protein
MRGIIDIIVALFGLSKVVYNNVDLDQAKKVHGFYIAKAIWFTPILIATMVGLNYLGFGWVNLLITLMVIMVALTISTRPELWVAAILGSATFGAIPTANVRKTSEKLQELDELEIQLEAATSEEEKVRLGRIIENLSSELAENANLTTFVSEFRKFFLLVLRTIGDIIFWISIFGMFLGTVSCRNNPKAVLSIAVILFVIGYGSYRWKMGPVIYKKIIYSYACIFLVVSLLSLVSAPRWIQMTGHDLGAIFHISRTEIALDKIEKTEKDTIDRENERILADIEKKIKDGKEVDAKELRFVQILKIEKQKNSLLNRIGEKFSSIEWPTPAVKQEAPAAAPAPTPTTTITNVYVSAPVAATPMPEPESVNLTGNLRFCYGICSVFAIKRNGTDFSGEGTYEEGGKIILTIHPGTNNSFRGDYEIIGHPKGYKKGTFDFVTDNNASGEGTWIHNNGARTSLSIRRSTT